MTVLEQAAALRTALTADQRAACHRHLAAVHAALAAAGLGDSPLADSLCDELDVYWLALEDRGHSTPPPPGR